ncbi:hypothetical protein M0R45_036419 [Rubus argutus]|uniref:Uncharacterized protein n=1 Tax=Rubus argutus TaxID=59490 RepID=A0AAW1VWX0_RUBAR
MEKLKNMSPAFYQSCSEMVSKLEVMASNHEGSFIKKEKQYSNSKRNKQIELLMRALHSVYHVPGMRFLPTKFNRRMKAIDREIQATLKRIISRKEEAMKAGDEATKNDLLGILLESNWNEIQQHGNNKNVGMSVEDVVGECKLFYFAGNETTSELLLVWTMIMLSRYQNWQARAREEILQVFGDNKPDFDGPVHLKVVSPVMCNSQSAPRIYNLKYINLCINRV